MSHPYPLILTKSQKEKAILDSLFRPINGQSLACVSTERFDRGKYASNMAGRPIPEHMLKYVAVVWCEQRKDSDGHYWALFSIPMPSVIPANAEIADDRLLAAAPALLAALEKALESIEGQAELLRHCGAAYGIGATLAQARAAIAKATGGAE